MQGRFRVYRAMLLVCLCLCVTRLTMAAPVDEARLTGLAWLLQHQHGDGSWRSAAGLEVPSTAVALIALRSAGLTGYSYAAAVAWLSNASPRSVEARAHQVLALRLAGVQVTPLLDRLLHARNGALTWGTYHQFGTSFVDTALTLMAFLTAAYPYDENALVTALCRIVVAQKADGTWAYISPGTTPPATAITSAIAPTVFNLLLLQTASATYASLTCNSVTYPFPTVLNQGVAGLLTRKRPDGGFGDTAVSTVLETALAYQALRTLRPTHAATTGALTYLLGQQTLTPGPAFGSWRHDAWQTALVLSMFPAPSPALLDTDGDDLPDAVESLLGTNPAVPDSRFLARGNGQSVAGVTTPITLPAATLGTAYSTILPNTGGSAPLTWRLLAGSVPPGMTFIATTGRLRGTPTALGTYSLLYEVTDAAGVRTPRVAQLSVQPAAPTVLSTAGMHQAALRVTAAARPGEPHSPTVEVFLAGSSAQQPILEALVRGMLVPDTMQVFYDDGGSPGVLSGQDYRVWDGLVHDTGSALDGQAVRIHYRTRGGSVYGVHPVALALPIERMVVDTTCTVVADGERQWSCPRDRTVLAIPDAGLSDVEPTLFVEGNLPTDATLPPAFHRPLIPAELAALTVLRPYAAVVGIAVTPPLPLTTLSTVQAAQMLSGQSQPLIDQPMTFCRRSTGAGIEAAANAYFLGNPCAPGSPGSVLTPEDSPDGVIVREVASTGALAACLSDVFASGAPAFGLLPVASTPGSEAGWRFIALDGVAPTVENAASGRYGWIIEPALLWRTTTVNGGAAPAGKPLLFLEVLAQRAGDSAMLGALSGVAALPPSGVAPPGRFDPASPVMGVSLFGDTCRFPHPVSVP